MSIAKNKAAVHLVVEEIFNKGNMAVVEEVVSPDWIYHPQMGPELKGPEGFKQMVAMEKKAAPDLHLTLDEMIAEGDKIAVRYIYAATFTGEFMGINPTGKKFSTKIAIFYRFKDGKQAEVTVISNMLEWFQQIGVNPPPG